MQTLAVGSSKTAWDFLAGVNGVEPEHWSRPTREIGGFLCTDSKKNDRANISDDELEALKDLAEQLLARTGKQLAEALNDGTLSEICHDH